jgi:hypothetical protein
MQPKYQGLAAANFAMESKFLLNRARATCVVDTGGKVATGINDTSGTGAKFTKYKVSPLKPVSPTTVVHLDLRFANTYENFRTNLNYLMLFSEA